MTWTPLPKFFTEAASIAMDYNRSTTLWLRFAPPPPLPFVLLQPGRHSSFLTAMAGREHATADISPAGISSCRRPDPLRLSTSAQSSEPALDYRSKHTLSTTGPD